ncbi:DUF3732 domain-containing protein [Jeotgalibacillus salarius]|uniref:DUF3732 domain-containing protein n=1 Tax=Jeotgalibacillus salarius TaxID=546023 RepID=A0A4Y8LSA9_9BACL|nr:DUF3732 domain-containing protein [Jeotgalibacillus salarius]TFE03845.1 DUF3732 domain-containing protein [Jeotgalibacillus salarius]
MRFHINKLILWFNNGKIRELEFENNKVNIITGESGTGKSEIISIIDYCFFSSKPNITEERINENVKWYGIKYNINDKNYTVARGAIQDRVVSKEYFFSPRGGIPRNPKSNIEEKDLKVIIDKEFSITENTVFPYGGKKISLGSKISPRYFFMFNTQSGDVISHSEVFFDNQNDDKYREALERIFDLAIGIESERNIGMREKVKKLDQEVNALTKKLNLIDKELNVFNDNLIDLFQLAKKYNLIGYTEIDQNSILPKLKEIVENYKEENIDYNLDKVNKLKSKKNSLIRKIRNLKRFKSEYENYKNIEKNNLDSLKPIEVIKKNYYNFLDLPDLNLLIKNLSEEFEQINENIKGKPPLNFNISKKIKEYEEQLESINDQITEVPLNSKQTKNEIDKIMFIGEMKAKLSLYEKQWDDSEDRQIIEALLKDKKEMKNELEESIVDYTERRESILNLLDELIQNYLDQSSAALGIYSGYRSNFIYKGKRLSLRKPKSIHPSKVGSSSNHLFLHLCFFFGLHELIIRQGSPYVPQWIILDQPSRPYFGEDNSEQKKSWNEIVNSDRNKITIAMTVINNFITYVNKELNTDFQIIVLEHIPKSIWVDAELENFYLVDSEFNGGNALIRFDTEGNPY